MSLSNKQRSNKKARIQKYCKITDIRSTSAGKTPSLETPPTGKSPGRLRTSPHTARARRKTGVQEFWSTGVLENITTIENCVVENLSFSLIFFLAASAAKSGLYIYISRWCVFGEIVKRERGIEIHRKGRCHTSFFGISSLRAPVGLTLEILQLVGEPVESFVQAVAGGGARALCVPAALA